MKDYLEPLLVDHKATAKKRQTAEDRRKAAYRKALLDITWTMVTTGQVPGMPEQTQAPMAMPAPQPAPAMMPPEMPMGAPGGYQ